MEDWTSDHLKLGFWSSNLVMKSLQNIWNLDPELRWQAVAVAYTNADIYAVIMFQIIN